MLEDSMLKLVLKIIKKPFEKQREIRWNLKNN